MAEFEKGVPKDAAFLAGWLRGMAERYAEGDGVAPDDIEALRHASELLADMAGVSKEVRA